MATFFLYIFMSRFSYLILIDFFLIQLFRPITPKINLAKVFELVIVKLAIFI
jgi:hypothetical protein